MEVIVICILILVGLGLVVMIGTKLFGGKGNDKIVEVPTSDCATCNGINAKCEQECQLEAATKPIEYYDDEELDTFSGRRSDDYSDEEAAQFAEVLETLKPEEVKPWGRSLILRGINMPDQIKDEFITLAEG